MAWRGALNINGWMTEEQLEWLYTTAQTMNSIVEIGSWMGRSTYALCAGCMGKVYAVDDFSGGPDLSHLVAQGANPYQSFRTNMKYFTNLEVIKEKSVEASLRPEIPPKVDMIFIDGEHTYDAVIADLMAWDSRAEKLICGHDYERKFKGVTHAVKGFYGRHNVTSMNRIWMVYK